MTFTPKIIEIVFALCAKRLYNTLHSDWSVVNFRCQKILVLFIIGYQQAIRKFSDLRYTVFIIRQHCVLLF